MAVFSEFDRSPIDELCAKWRETSLLEDASLLHPDDFSSCWSHDGLVDLNERFWGNLLEGAEGGGKFESKWEQQLEGASIEVRLLAAECLLVYYLVTSSVGAERKLHMINTTIGADRSDLHVPRDGVVYAALKNHIANPGMYYNTRQDIHVGYLMELGLRLKQLPIDDRRELLIDNPWGFAEFTEGNEHPSDAMRHITCHLLYPEQFERIASNRHKQLVLRAFGQFDDCGPNAGQDQRLFAIRTKLKSLLPGWDEERRDYYRPDFEPIWRPLTTSGADAVMDPALALDFKKQIVLYGPPGTGKTYQANLLAESLIRTATLKRWGAEGYFGKVEAANAAVSEHVTRLQMHPSFGYAEFMVGLQLDADGATRHRLGALPRLVERMRAEQLEMGEGALPHVLILDEINRTDLSTMFGEAFSVIERDKRGVEIDLFAQDERGETMRFALPPDLFIIGTMNEIDQSVEALDFALRRRFFWFATPYNEQDLYAIWDAQWEELSVKVDWEDAVPQLDELGACITRLNKRITELPELGREYELGAAVFGDLAYFIGLEWQHKSHGRRSGKYLWDKKGAARAPLLSLWELSIKPVLAQYLAGSDRREEQLAELQQLLLSRPTS